MKKIFLLLALVFFFSANAQRTYTIESQLKLNTVNLGVKSDSILVRGADKIVKFVPRSSFTGGGASGVASVTGTLVNNTDPLNPVVNTPNLSSVLATGNSANNGIELTNGTFTTSLDVGTFYCSNGSTQAIFGYPDLFRASTFGVSYSEYKSDGFRYYTSSSLGSKSTYLRYSTPVEDCFYFFPSKASGGSYNIPITIDGKTADSEGNINTQTLDVAPASSTSAGKEGERRYTSSGVYICTATDTWIKCVGLTF